MNTDYQDFKYKELTEEIIKIFYNVYNKLHEAQLLNYLKATNIEVGLLLNFDPEPEVRRKAFDNIRK